MLLTEFDPPISSETYALARASLISRSFRDLIGTIKTDDADFDGHLAEAYTFLDDLGHECSERSLNDDVDPAEVAKVYHSDTLSVLATALHDGSGGFEFHDEIAQLVPISLLISKARS